MLIQTLHKLEDQWYVAKQKTTGKILQSLYYLTPLGEKILTLWEQMADIGKTL
jgi:DNA-binding HxlR family transcriptional regulator